MINLLLFFRKTNDYVIIKKSDIFPLYVQGDDDVDILCKNKNLFAHNIIKILKKNYSQYSYNFINRKDKIHIDVYLNKQFIIKFDICDNLKRMYKDFNIPDGILDNILKKSVEVNGVRFPRIEDECMIRKLEYDTFIKTRPDKIKHLHFLNKNKNIKYRIFNHK